jgi:hypothetical protein
MRKRRLGADQPDHERQGVQAVPATDVTTITATVAAANEFDEISCWHATASLPMSLQGSDLMKRYHPAAVTFDHLATVTFDLSLDLRAKRFQRVLAEGTHHDAANIKREPFVFW